MLQWHQTNIFIYVGRVVGINHDFTKQALYNFMYSLDDIIFFDVLVACLLLCSDLHWKKFYLFGVFVTTPKEHSFILLVLHHNCKFLFLQFICYRYFFLLLNLCFLAVSFQFVLPVYANLSFSVVFCCYFYLFWVEFMVFLMLFWGPWWLLRRVINANVVFNLCL